MCVCVCVSGVCVSGVCFLLLLKVFEPLAAARLEDEEEPAQKWMKITGGPFTKADNFCADLRRLQQRCGCSDVTCEDFLATFSKYFGGISTPPSNFRN